MQLVIMRVDWAFPGSNKIHQNEFVFPQPGNQPDEYLVSLCSDAILKALISVHQVAEKV